MFLQFFYIVGKRLPGVGLAALNLNLVGLAHECYTSAKMQLHQPHSSIGARRFLGLTFLALWAVMLTGSLPSSLHARDKKDAVQYGAGLIVNIPAPEADVIKAVEEVVQNGLIRGTKEYSKDEYVKGAIAATGSSVFPAWTEGGKVYYKVRQHALDPINFKDAGDVGTLAVRYIVTGQDEKHTVLQINALFVEEFRHFVHPSNGTVESSEYKDIHDHVEAMGAMKDQAVEAEREKQEATQSKFLAANSTPAPVAAPLPPAETRVEATPAVSTTSSIEDLQERLREVRQQTQRKVKKSGAPLKSAPFHTATNLQSLNGGTEVLIVISTPYWYGVETHEGQHGWMQREDLEELP